MRHGDGEADPRLAVRFVDEQSGRNDLLGRVASLDAMAHVVARRLEGARIGSRFPLLRLVGRKEPLSAPECEALAREVARLRAALAPLPTSALVEIDASPAPADASSVRSERPDGSPAQAEDDPSFRRLPFAGAPRTLADAFAWPLFVLEHIARLGAATRRGARFEVGDESVFAAARTPLNPHEALGGAASPVSGSAGVASRAAPR